ncbi:hypothetical protein [Natrarchaeobaculum sulfurireducens]|uniref:Uncharacterized protein n=1 Tax=Natrarchaeobaculum sulfurireducens TaxID=2044521 RepID=A0A346PHI5_9EURY|nr:hypothetical protein [Natrarchaeobaculum sulfurireducens]AXR78980.1 hypothetical protein AArc1_2667 [Natrarchaeobaculum sulfurireducens]
MTYSGNIDFDGDLTDLDMEPVVYLFDMNTGEKVGMGMVDEDGDYTISDYDDGEIMAVAVGYEDQANPVYYTDRPDINIDDSDKKGYWTGFNVVESGDVNRLSGGWERWGDSGIGDLDLETDTDAVYGNNVLRWDTNTGGNYGQIWSIVGEHEDVDIIARAEVTDIYYRVLARADMDEEGDGHRALARIDDDQVAVRAFDEDGNLIDSESSGITRTGDWAWSRFRCEGDEYKGKAWDGDDSIHDEPDDWEVEIELENIGEGGVGIQTTSFSEWAIDYFSVGVDGHEPPRIDEP